MDTQFFAAGKKIVAYKNKVFVSAYVKIWTMLRLLPNQINEISIQ